MFETNAMRLPSRTRSRTESAVTCLARDAAWTTVLVDIGTPDSTSAMLAGWPIGRIAGPDAMQVNEWNRLVGEYATLLGAEPPRWAANAGG